MAVIDTLTVNLTTQVAGLSKGLKSAENMIGTFSKNATRALAGFGAAFAGVFTVSKLTGFLQSGADFADNISDTAARLQITAESFNQLRHAAELSDVGVEDLTRGMERLAKEMNEAPDVALLKFADHIKAMPNIYDRAAAAAEVFGKSGVKLLPLLNQGGMGILELGKEVEGLFSPERQKLLDDYDNAMKSLRETWMKFAIVAAQEVAPVAKDIAVLLAGWANSLAKITGTGSGPGAAATRESRRLSLQSSANFAGGMFPFFAAANPAKAEELLFRSFTQGRAAAILGGDRSGGAQEIRELIGAVESLGDDYKQTVKLLQDILNESQKQPAQPAEL